MILRAVELSSAGVKSGSARLLGIAIAVAVGLFFFQGTLKIPLHRFFAATSVILMVVAFQLALTGVHELSEAMWIWSSKTEMATVGPIVRNEIFFFVVILGAAALVVLREWFGAAAPVADEADAIRPSGECANGNSAGSGAGVSRRRFFAYSWSDRWPRSLSMHAP